MRVLFLVHDFLPAHPSGTEAYTGALALRLAERGHEVRIFATEKDIARPHLALERRTWQGLVVHELVNNLFYADFRETWDFPPAERAFAGVLDEFRPDVVHVMHLMYLSVGCVEAAHRRSLPVFLTLHDFWLQCARFGQRIHADGALCHTIDFARCGTCLARFEYAQSPLARRAARVIAGVKSASGVDLGNLARAAGERLRARRGRRASEPDAADARRFEAAARARETELRRRLLPCVERFFAPSRFLRERFREWGLPEERLETLAYGLELEPFRALTKASPGSRAAPGTLRVAFLGTLAPHKAPHLVLEALALLPAELAARTTVTLYGPKHHFPEYVAGLERRAGALGARLPGALGREEVPAVLAAADLVIVPSVWYENSPLTIHEARAARTAVLVSDLGGMAELVEPDRQGWRFRGGDARDLAAHLERLLRDPGLLARLDFDPPPKDMRVNAAELEERYQAARARAREGRR
jgi:glycosyltransferase involved in cell wall biosynthesis